MEKQTHTLIDHLKGNKVQLFITIVSTVIALINLLIVRQLAPVARDVSELSKDLRAIEQDYTPRSDFRINIENLNSRLDRIEANQDTILQRLN